MRSVDSRWNIAYGRRVRRTAYRLVLPEGPLRRFRLPESFGDDAPTRREVRSLPLGAVAGWLGVCVCSWVFARGALDPIAMLERRWEMPTDESGASRIAMAAAFGPVAAAVPLTSEVTGAAPTPTVAPVVAPAPLHAALAASRSALPRVNFPDVGGHGGGWSLAPDVRLESPETAVRDGETELDSPLRSAPPRADDGTLPLRVGTPRAATPFPSTLADTVRDLVATAEPALPRPGPTNRGPDPFEADFGASSLPSLSQASSASAPVKLSASRMPAGAPRETPDVELAPVSGERGTFTWNGGCQRVFDSSVQQVGPGVAARDATPEDYSRALSRLDVTACHPSPHTNVEVCVAVSSGRASGVTVHTKPSSPALGQCVARRVRALSFPASGGTDLVRTQFRVD